MRGRTLSLAVYALLSLTFVLVGCSSDNAASPPASASMSSESGRAGADMAGVIFVVPLEGAPTRTGLILADAIAAGIRDRNHPAILSFEPNQAGASVVGKVTSADVRGNVVWLGVDWAIRAPYGTHVASYSQKVVIDALMWRNAAPEAINLIIDDVAPKLAAMVNSEVGPPVMSAMYRPEDAAAQSQEAAAPAVPQSGPATTMEMRQSEMRQLEQQANAETRDMRPDLSPPPIRAPEVQPLARIAEETNGQVVHSPGLKEMQPSVSASASGDAAPVRLNPPGAAPTAPAQPSAAGSGVETASAPPEGLPSLLTPVPEAADNVAASSGPQRLTPGSSIVQPPPGGITSASSSTEEGSGSFLDALTPSMDTDKRLPDDARPAGSGGAAFAKVRWGQPSFLIKPVRGAPGNGNEALTAALKSALRDKDLTISEDPRQAGFVIQGDVNTGEPVSGRQYIRIIWRVNTVTGEEVGKAVQENTVVAGSLNGEWGQVAEAVSHAAVRGIKDLFSDADEHLTSREPLPDFPDVQLQAVPGRAPPPPTSY